MPNWSDYLDVLGQLRYGVPTSQKEALAAQGALPGAPQDPTAEQERANRYASGYLFGQQWPNVAPAVQPWVDRIKTSNLPFLGGSSPELQSYASQGVAKGATSKSDIKDLMKALKRKPGKAAMQTPPPTLPVVGPDPPQIGDLLPRDNPYGY